MFWNHDVGIIVKLVVIILLSQTSAECPDDKPIALCTKAPCDVTSCSCFTDATCRNDYCGGCNAKFYIGTTEVTKNCDLCVKDKLGLLGSSGNDGIVELYVNGGSWKKLCSAWKFGDNDADIACKELGFNKGFSLPTAAYGPMGGEYTMPLTGCNAGVGSIMDCNYDQNSTLCLHQNVFYASVVCSDGTQKPVVTDLIESTSNNDTHYGRVKLYRRNVWGQVCSTFWSDLDAAVYCRQMNYTGGYALKYKGISGIPFVKTGINCNGNESDIDTCQSQTQICYDGDAAGVLCYKNTGLSISLEDGGNTYGRVDVTFDGKRGTICNIGWTDEDADVVCRQLGYKSGTRYYGSLPSGTGEVYLSNLRCTSLENTLLMCESSGWANVTDTKCLDHSNDAGVYCYDNVRLSGGRTNKNISMGRIEVYQKVHTTGMGYWSTLCAEQFDQADADVVCRQLRYLRAKILSPGIFGRTVYFSYTTSINCTGDEDQVLDCPHTVSNRCRNYDYASVICMMEHVKDDFEISLAKEDSGLVYVEQYGVYGTICLDGWDDKDADVVCRSRGFNGGKSFGTTQTYTRYDPIWLTEIDCKGTENRIQDCSVSFDVPLSCGKQRSSAGVICYKSSGLKTRIVGGNSPNQGRLEVSRDGVWGTVCDNSWSTYDARVACKELGYPDGISYLRSYHGPGTGPIHMDGLNCRGTEKSIFECPNNGWNVSSPLCNDHSKDAGVFCFLWVTLSQGGSLYGAVQVWKEGSGYGEVCSDGFNDTDAKIVCREIGYTTAISLCCSSFGHWGLPFVMSNVQCTGSENSIRNCLHESENPVCNSNTYASVVCSTSMPPGGWSVRSLIGNVNQDFGYVQVNYFNHLGMVCSEGFDDKDAEVVCRENGYVTGFSYKHNTSSRVYRHNIRWLSNVMCKGTEDLFSQCGNLNWGQTGVCSQLNAAGVFCVRTAGITGIAVRLTNGTTVEGRVELKIDSTWQSLCDSYLTNREASTLCRSQGFLDGVILKPGKFGNGTSYIPITSVNCTGNETKVTDCILDVTSGSICNSGAAAIKCYTTVRLTGSDVVEYGRLEMFNGTGWDAVCDDEFDDGDANVVCRYMGYAAGKYQCCSRLGRIPPTTRIAITKFNCNGQESKPQDCKFVNGTCNTGHYVSVLCISTFRGEDLSVRLPLNSFYGPVEVRRFGLWGYVCDSYWTDNEANVVCKHLGFQSGKAVKTKINDRVPIIMGNVSCFGSETSLDHCRRTLFGADHGCFSRETAAGVICSNKPVNGITFDNTDSGLASIQVDDNTLVVDSMNFDNSDAKVLCKSKGYAGGTASKFGGRQEVNVVDVSCTGNENSFLQCKAFWDPRKSKTNMPAGVRCHRYVRLSAGASHYGIVEVYKNDTWGTICNKGFDAIDANIVCTELDFERGMSLCCAPFGYIPSAHTISDIQCTGSEPTVTSCKFKWAKDAADVLSICDVPWDYSSVLCYNGIIDNAYKLDIRGTAYTGEVVLTYMKVPGRICADGWDDKDARVVCRELNYKHGLAYKHYVAEGPRTHGPYWTSSVKCTGSETNLGDCAKTVFGSVSHCNTRHYAGVLCYNEEGLYYRLTGGDERYGRIEVYLYDQWGSICDTHWDQREAHVYCKQINYATGDPYYGAYNSPGAREVFETQFECTGSESDLNACPHGRWETATSQRCLLRDNNAGVFCYTSVKLHSGIGRETSDGAVLYYKYNQWNLVCDDGFTDSSAKLVCQELGFIDGRATCCSNYGKLPWQLLTNHTIKCSGSEPDVVTCEKTETCRSQTYASVKCYDYILPTTESPSSTTKPVTVIIGGTTGVSTRTGSDDIPTIIGVVVAVLVLIIVIIVVVIFLIRWQRNSKAKHKHQQFHNDILEHAHDGSVRVQNPLHEIPHSADTDTLTISSTGVVSYLPSTEINKVAISNPTYATSEPIRTVINVSKKDTNPNSELEYASLRLSTQGQTNIYDNLVNEGDTDVDTRPANDVDPNLRLSLAEAAEIHSPDHNVEEINWPDLQQSSNHDNRTEL